MNILPLEPSPRELAIQHREMCERVAPFIKAKADIMALMMPVIIMHADDPFAHYIYSPEQQAVLDAIDTLISEVAKP